MKHPRETMGRRLLWCAAGVLFTWRGARAARADSCVEIDTERDNLADADRAAARAMLVRAFEVNGQTMATTNCQATYRVYHLKIDSSITVVLSGPTGTRSRHVARVEDIPNAYAAMVPSLLNGTPMPLEPGTDAATPEAVTAPIAPSASPGPTTAAPPAPVIAPTAGTSAPGASTAAPVAATPVETSTAASDSVWYARLGYGVVASAEARSGPAFGFGYRYESGHLGIDASIFNFTLTRDDQTFDDLSGAWARLAALAYLGDIHDPSLYGGAGIGWGVSNVRIKGNRYHNNGLDFELTLGYEAMRGNAVRLFIQLDASIPTYTAHTTLLSFDGSTASTTSASLYTPSFALSLGIGFANQKK